MVTPTPVTDWSEFVGGRGILGYTCNNPFVEYPDESNVTTLGTTYLPRVYARDLNALELASSGIVTVSLADTRSINMSRDAASSNVRLATMCNDSFEVTAQGVGISMDGPNDDMTINASNDLTTNLGNSYTLNASNLVSMSMSNLDMTIDGGNMFLNMNTTSNHELAVHTESNLYVSASNNMDLLAQEDTLIRSRNADGSKQHLIRFDQGSNLFKMMTTGTYDMEIDGTPIMTLNNSNVNIYGNLNLEGVLNATKSVVENQLQVRDKTINLATSSNFLDSLDTSNVEYDYDNLLNDGAGVAVEGIPSNIVVPSNMTEHDVADYYEKSLRWHHNTGGVLALGGSNITDEAQWHLKGGAFYLTLPKVDANGNKTHETSFGLRINEREELEMVKVSNKNGSNIVKRVARFGYTLGY